MDAVGVVVPARDEEERVAACLHSVLAALPAGVATAVVAVLDRCTDRTADRVPDGVEVLINDGAACVGELRDRGVRHLLSRLAARPDRTWLLSTDRTSSPVSSSSVRARSESAIVTRPRAPLDLASSINSSVWRRE